METRNEPEREIAREAREGAREMRDRAEARIEEQKRSAAQEVHGIVTALRTAADQLDSQNQQPAARYARRAAEWVDRFGNAMERKSVREILEDVERMTREQPATAIGVAAAVGFVGSRFLRSSPRALEEERAPELPERPHEAAVSPRPARAESTLGEPRLESRSPLFPGREEGGV